MDPSQLHDRASDTANKLSTQLMSGEQHTGERAQQPQGLDSGVSSRPMSFAGPSPSSSTAMPTSRPTSFAAPPHGSAPTSNGLPGYLKGTGAPASNVASGFPSEAASATVTPVHPSTGVSPAATAHPAVSNPLLHLESAPSTASSTASNANTPLASRSDPLSQTPASSSADEHVAPGHSDANVTAPSHEHVPSHAAKEPAAEHETSETHAFSDATARPGTTLSHLASNLVAHPAETLQNLATHPRETVAEMAAEAPPGVPARTTERGVPSEAAGMNLPRSNPAPVTAQTTTTTTTTTTSSTTLNQATLAPGGKVRLTNYPAIKNAPLPAEGNGTFSNTTLALLIFFTPAVLLRVLPFVKARWFGWTSYLVLVALCGLPVTIAYWTIMSHIGPRINEKVELPNRPIEYYLDIRDPALRARYHGHNKIPMQVFWDAYIDGKIEVKGDLIEVLEYRLDWAAMVFTPELFRYVLFQMLPDVLMHSSRQDEQQIRDNYDRGNDFYEWFLGPQMVYTTGIISDPLREESLEELQDNKLNLVCSKLGLQPGDRVLDIGCGWGTFAAFAARNYGADVTGVTLAREQVAFGTQRLQRNRIPPQQARLLCMDYRDIPVQPGHYNKIVCLEMAEHVGIRHYSKFLRNVYDLLDDDGVMVFQVAGLRPRWQYWDLIWGLFMNKYIFPGADASCPLNWVIRQLETAGFEVRSCDVAGIHYSATIDRWLKNWKINETKIKAKYGERLYRLWHFFLASSVIIAREGGSSLFQITVTKNLNATHRIEGVASHGNLLPRPFPGKPYVSVYH